MEFEIKKLGGDSTKLFLGGYGNGASMAIAAFLNFKGGALGGLTGVSGCNCANIDWTKVDIETKKKTPMKFWHDQ
jgi:predicted esterase